MNRTMPRVLGIAGGIGSGKSVVSRLLEVMGIPVFDCDREAKALYDQDPQLKEQLTARLGANLYPEAQGGLFDPKALARIIFEHTSVRQEVEALVHPAVGRAFMCWQELHSSCSWVGVESAILYPSGFSRYCTAVVWVEAPEEERIIRILKRDATTREEALRRIQAQKQIMPEEDTSFYQVFNGEDRPLIPTICTLLQQLETDFPRFVGGC